jgi:septum site-determining protein MinC
MKNTISIKGTREGLTITLGSGEMHDILEDLAQHLATQGEFFRGGTVALQVGDRAVAEGELTEIGDLLGRYDMTLRTVMTSNVETENATRVLGLRLLSQQPMAEAAPRAVAPPAAANPLDGSRGVLIRHVVRSGQVVRHTGHVVVVGDVNVGAEIVAGGDIVIWGRLYGTVHAGSMDNDDAVVCALELAPLQLRIGQAIARPEEGDRPRKTYPEVAAVRENRIVVEPWDQALRGR